MRLGRSCRRFLGFSLRTKGLGQHVLRYLKSGPWLTLGGMGEASMKSEKNSSFISIETYSVSLSHFLECVFSFEVKLEKESI